MAEIVLYIAHSVDGYIADAAGGVDWLKRYHGQDYGYDRFFAGIDAVVMGRRTYVDVRGFGDWPYKGRSAIVMTKGRAVDADGHAVFDDRTPAEIVADLIHAGRRHIWIVGGGGPVRAFLDARLLDRLILFQMPDILGRGTPLWREGRRSVALALKRATVHDGGVVETEYAVGRA